MTRKDYIALAYGIKAALSIYVVPCTDADMERYRMARKGIERTAHNVADVLAADNPRFDRANFLTACGF